MPFCLSPSTLYSVISDIIKSFSFKFFILIHSLQIKIEKVKRELVNKAINNLPMISIYLSVKCKFQGKILPTKFRFVDSKVLSSIIRST
jgi:UDP-N-acetylglucosamine enolpyruvyl transferase